MRPQRASAVANQTAHRPMGGTARPPISTESGIVDHNCKVFDIDKLRVAERAVSANSGHHSTAGKPLDKNFGLALSIWDRLFGTMVLPELDKEFGLTGGEHADYQSLYGLHVVPLKKKIAVRTDLFVPRRSTIRPDHYAGESV